MTLSDYDMPLADTTAVEIFFNNLKTDFFNAQDSLLASKIAQAYHANKYRASDHYFTVKDKVLLAIAHCRHDYIQAKDGCITKFMSCFNGLYKFIHAFLTLLLSDVTHISLIIFITTTSLSTKDDNLFSSHALL
ncbi:hypothetical protein Hypma_008163 [Hypsizygus marmoreus]|uniref:Uncharacterized protein n=1 Tax=Hypsizygus marmoreus TaxID=39966 RepID=A0A369JQT0_HYPMA|nr:hypothetical protein Hypma_008163 [Hypsizygus marmoreus]